jgi:GTPase SAR1 family protein
MKKITGIEIVMGKPGVGKSTYCAKVAKQYLDKAVPVWSNYPIKGCLKLYFSTICSSSDIPTKVVTSFKHK